MNKIDYENVKKYLESNYVEIDDNNTVYYFNENGKIIAQSKDDKIINIYFKTIANSHEHIWSHNGIVALAIIKDFSFPSKNPEINYVSDVATYSGLCGTFDEIAMKTDSFFEDDRSRNLELSNHLGTINIVSFYKRNPVFRISKDLEIELNRAEDSRNCLNFQIIDAPVSEISIDKDKIMSNYLKIRNENSWYYETGYNTCNSNIRRGFIESLKSNSDSFYNYNYNQKKYSKTKTKDICLKLKSLGYVSEININDNYNNNSTMLETIELAANTGETRLAARYLRKIK